MGERHLRLPLWLLAAEVHPPETLSTHLSQEVVDRQHWRRPLHPAGSRHHLEAGQWTMVNGQWSILYVFASLVGLCPYRCSLRHLGRPGREPHQTPTWHQRQRQHPSRPWRTARPLRQCSGHHPRLGRLLHIDIISGFFFALKRKSRNFAPAIAQMVELVDTRDLKSLGQ